MPIPDESSASSVPRRSRKVSNRIKMIAMTAPVHIWEEGDGTMMAFTMPSEYSMEELPSPNDDGVHLVNAEGRSFAALSFTGLSGTRKTDRLKKRLMRLVSETGLEASGPALLAVYDNLVRPKPLAE